MARNKLVRYFYPFLLLLVISSFVQADTVVATIENNSDDGTEMDGIAWYENGWNMALNCLGRMNTSRCEVGLRFLVPELNQGDQIAFARIRFASYGGEIASGAHLTIQGILQANPTTFSATERPSQKKPRTRNRILWDLYNTWKEDQPNKLRDVPLYYSSEDIAPLINEILSLEDWGNETKSLQFILMDRSRGILNNHVLFSDYDKYMPSKKSPPMLEIYPAVYDTFLGKEMLGKVTDRSIAVRLFSLLQTDTFIEYGTTPERMSWNTKPCLNWPAGRPIEITLHDLKPDTEYYFRLAFRKSGETEYSLGPVRRFHTQRSKGARFSFAIQADEHLQKMYIRPGNGKDKALYRIALDNIAAGDPDFFLSLGDFVNTEFYAGRTAAHFKEALNRYLMQRSYIDTIANSIPFFLVVGNHEGEQGWNRYGENPTYKNLAQYSNLARRSAIPNPRPDAFYSGNSDSSLNRAIENYYAWEWGDALFIVLDPFWYTYTKPHDIGEGAGSLNCWDWTLGKDQYEWLYATLRKSKARWKFVFTHHCTTSKAEGWGAHYGRGGIEVVKFAVDNRPSFEWGGEDEYGHYVYGFKRPGWLHGSIHDLLRDAGVDIVFKGHDHFFAKQDLEKIVYQTCPQPADSDYSFGYKIQGDYKYGDFLPNSGHLQVTVDPEFVQVDYLRAFLPGDGVNGESAYSYILEEIPPCVVDLNPPRGAVQVCRDTPISLTLFDAHSGIDPDRTTVWINGDIVLESGCFQTGYLGTLESTDQQCRLSIDPRRDLPSGSVIPIRVTTQDRANLPNTADLTYSFITEQ